MSLIIPKSPFIRTLAQKLVFVHTFLLFKSEAYKKLINMRHFETSM